MEYGLCDRKYLHAADLVLKQVDAVETANLRRRRASFQIDKCLPQLDDILDSYLLPLHAASESTLSPSCKLSLPLADELSSDEEISLDPSPRKLAGSRKRRKEIEESYEVEIIRLRDIVRQCFRAVISIDTNADLKVKKLELELETVRKELADERAENSKLMILNESLRKRYQAVTEGKTISEEIAMLNRRELTVEKHVNSLLSARNNYASENHMLKQMILNACPDCRRDLAFNRRSTMMRDGNPSPKVEFGHGDAAVKKPSTPTNRPTWHSNAQKLLQEEIPKSLERKVPLSHPTRIAHERVYAPRNVAQENPQRRKSFSKEGDSNEATFLFNPMTKIKSSQENGFAQNDADGDMKFIDKSMISGKIGSQVTHQTQEVKCAQDDTRTSASPELSSRIPDDTHERETSMFSFHTTAQQMSRAQGSLRSSTSKTIWPTKHRMVSS